MDRAAKQSKGSFPAPRLKSRCHEVVRMRVRGMARHGKSTRTTFPAWVIRLVCTSP